MDNISDELNLRQIVLLLHGKNPENRILARKDRGLGELLFSLIQQKQIGLTSYYFVPLARGTATKLRGGLTRIPKLKVL